MRGRSERCYQVRKAYQHIEQVMQRKLVCKYKCTVIRSQQINGLTMEYTSPVTMKIRMPSEYRLTKPEGLERTIFFYTQICKKLDYHWKREFEDESF